MKSKFRQCSCGDSLRDSTLTVLKRWENELEMKKGAAAELRQIRISFSAIRQPRAICYGVGYPDGTWDLRLLPVPLVVGSDGKEDVAVLSLPDAPKVVFGFLIVEEPSELIAIELQTLR